jgi:hypothetical protein
LSADESCLKFTDNFFAEIKLHRIDPTQVVSSCRESGCSVHRVSYNVPMSQMIAVTTLSKECEQHIQVGSILRPFLKIIFMIYVCIYKVFAIPALNTSIY